MAVTLVALLAATLPAAAQPVFGARAGLTANPDQIHFGAHAKVLEMAPGLLFLPNIEIGLGDDAMLLAFNAEFTYTFSETQWRRWHPYAGGGLGVNVLEPDAADSRTDVGLNALIGVSKVLNIGHEFFAELKLGLEDSPDLKLTLGFSFF